MDDAPDRDAPQAIREADVPVGRVEGVSLVERAASADFVVFLRLSELGWRYLSASRPVGRMKTWTDYWTIRSKLTGWGYSGTVCCHQEGSQDLLSMGLRMP